jgi:hypothetical protein
MATGTGNLPNQNMDFVPLATLPAADLDKLVDNIEALADGTGIGDGAVTNAKLDTTAGEPGGKWKAYTPTLTGAVTNPTLGSSTVTGRYTQVGKTVICHVLYTIVTGGAFNAGSGLYRFSLPVAANTTAPAAYDGIGVIFDSGTEFMVAIAKMASAGTQVELSKAKDGLNLSNNTPIATWANGDYVRFTITYEAA